MSGLHLLNQPGTPQPSPPAYTQKWKLEIELELLQLLAMGLDHVYEV